MQLMYTAIKSIYTHRYLRILLYCLSLMISILQYAVIEECIWILTSTFVVPQKDLFERTPLNKLFDKTVNQKSEDAHQLLLR